MREIARAKVKLRKAKEKLSAELGIKTKRRFGKDDYFLYKTAGSKFVANKIAEEERKKGYYIRITRNKPLKKYLVWRG